MNFQYFFILIPIILALFLIALGIIKTTKIFLGNYFAGFSAIISYVSIDILINFIDQHPKFFGISNPDITAGFLMNYKTIIVIISYLLFLILFYKSNLFEIKIEGFIKKSISYLILPITTVINLLFTMILIINGPNILTYEGYENFIKALKITNIYILQFIKYLPGLVILIPFLLLILFIDINIKISIPSIRKNTTKEDKDKIEAENN